MEGSPAQQAQFMLLTKTGGAIYISNFSSEFFGGDQAHTEVE